MAAPTYGYNKDTDYSKLIEEAIKAGDMARAAIYEAQRNEKIAGEGLSQYQTTNQYATYLPGTYDGKGYENPYAQELEAAIGRLQDTGAYKKAYLREADRTMEDTLAQYGTMTGGLPSTQAVAAASQAADYYKSQLGEKLADLDRQNANLLLSAGSQAQSEYQMMISDALNRWTQLGYADDQVAQILGVAIGTPTSDQSYINWQKGQQDKSDAYSMAMTLLQTGQMPNADTLAAAGISAEDAQMLLNSMRSYSSGSYKGEKDNLKPITDDKVWAQMLAYAQEAQKTGDWTAYELERTRQFAKGYNASAIDDWLILNGIVPGSGGTGSNTSGSTGGYTGFFQTAP